MQWHFCLYNLAYYVHFVPSIVFLQYFGYWWTWWMIKDPPFSLSLNTIHHRFSHPISDHVRFLIYNLGSDHKFLLNIFRLLWDHHFPIAILVKWFKVYGRLQTPDHLWTCNEAVLWWDTLVYKLYQNLQFKSTVLYFSILYKGQW